MNIGSICSRHIVTIDSASTLVEAAALMREHQVGALVVTTRTPEGPRVAGLVTDRDLVIDVLARGLDGIGVKIGELAGHRIVCVADDDDLLGAMTLMREQGVRRLLVSNAHHRLIGMVSLDDLLEAWAGAMDVLAEAGGDGIEHKGAETSMPPAPASLLRMPAIDTAGWSGTAA